MRPMRPCERRRWQKLLCSRAPSVKICKQLSNMAGQARTMH